MFCLCCMLCDTGKILRVLWASLFLLSKMGIIVFRLRTSLVVQWVRLCPRKVQGWGSIPGQETRSHMLQLRVHMPHLKIPCFATKTWHSQINIKKNVSPITASWGLLRFLKPQNKDDVHAFSFQNKENLYACKLWRIQFSIYIMYYTPCTSDQGRRSSTSLTRSHGF